MSEEADGHELLRFVVTFIMSWKIWTDITLTLGWFESDDVLTRLEILLAIALLLAFVSHCPFVTSLPSLTGAASPPI